MERDPPEAVKAALKQEVNFGCPVPDCGCPLLELHHFDPPWSEREHHNLRGMIALCSAHHPRSRDGLVSLEQGRTWKAKPNPFDLMQRKFPWLPAQSCLLRLGGCYAPNKCRLVIDGVDVLRIRRDDNRLNTLSFFLADQQGETVAQMDDNLFSGTPNLRDLQVAAKSEQVRIWSDQSQTGLHFRYHKLDIYEVEDMLQRDFARSSDALPTPEPIDDLEGFYQQLAGILHFYPDVITLGSERNDPVGTSARWHAARNLDSDGRIPILDFLAFRFRGKHRTVELRDERIWSSTSDAPLACSMASTFEFA